MTFTMLAGNTAQTYASALAVTLLALVFFAVLEHSVLAYLARAAARSKNRVDDALVAMAKSVKPPFYWFLSIYLGLKILVLPAIVGTVIDGLLLAWFLYFAVRAANAAVNIAFVRSAASASEREARRLLAALAKGVLWAIAILLLLSNLGVNVTSLVAGLGIGGVTVAFALQNILADLFSSFAIHFDKPFEVGDFIVVGDYLGTVSKIGIKTTRLASLSGEEIVMANRELTSSSVRNFKRMRQRRVQVDFGIRYETPRATVAVLPGKIRDALGAIPGVRVDRVHFAGFGDSALTFELVYYVDGNDYTTYMNYQERISLALLELFEREGVSFAYPTRTVYAVKSP